MYLEFTRSILHYTAVLLAYFFNYSSTSFSSPVDCSLHEAATNEGRRQNIRSGGQLARTHAHVRSLGRKKYPTHNAMRVHYWW